MNTNSYMPKAKTSEYGTPQWLFDKLNERFKFTLDPCATVENAKCKKFFTKEQNGLLQSWQEHRVFMNPPYGRELKLWTEKAKVETEFGNCLVVGLLPVRTDTKWFHKFVLPYADVEFIKGRLKFEGNTNSAPFPSMIVIWGNGEKKLLGTCKTCVHYVFESGFCKLTLLYRYEKDVCAAYVERTVV